MLEILSITLPIYLIAALGYLLVRLGVFEQRDLQALSKFVVTVAFPALLFSAIAQSDFSTFFDAYYVIIYALAGLGMIGIAAIWILVIRRQSIGMASVVALGVAMPNNGFVGYPILLFAFGDIAARFLALNFLVENIVVLSLILVGLESSKETGARSAGLVGRVFRRVVSNPILVALALGVVVSVLGLQLPTFLTRSIDLMAKIAAGLALFFIGGTLVGTRIDKIDPLVWPIVFAKLIVHPLLVVVLLGLAAVFGFGAIDPVLLPGLVLAAAMPAIASYPAFVYAQGQAQLAATVVIVGLILSFATVSALLWYLA